MTSLDQQTRAAITPSDVWTETDYPVLLALAAWSVNDQHMPFISLEEVTVALGWSAQDEDRIGYAVERLDHAGLIEVLDATMGKPYPMLVRRVTTSGLRASGAWPSEASVLDALEDALADLADREEAANPEEASKLRAAAGVVGRMAVSVGTDFASRLVAHAAGFPESRVTMSHLLVIFGAGASYDSVDPQIAPRMREIAGLDVVAYSAAHDNFRPPLARDLFDDRRNFGRVLDRPSLHVARPLIASLRYAVLRGESVEDALGTKMDAARTDTHSDVRLLRQLAAVRFYLQEAIADCGSEWSALANGITNYGFLLDRIERWRGATNSVSLVTFNYDTMLERACWDALEWNIATINDYVAGFNPPRVLIKPHGSVNWARVGGPLSTAVRTGNPEQLIQNMIDDSPALMFPQSDAHFVVLPDLQPWYQPPDAGEQSYYAFPALATPLAEKSQFECPPSHLDVLGERVHAVDRLLVIGWRGAERHFMDRYNGQVPHHAKILVVGGGDCDYTLIRDGLDLRGEVTMFCEGLSAFLRTDALETFLAD